MSNVEDFKKKLNLIENTVFYEPYYPFQLLKNSIKKYKNSINKQMIDFAETSMDYDYIKKKKMIFERDKKNSLKKINNFKKGHRYSLLRYNRKSLMNYNPLLAKIQTYKSNKNLRNKSKDLKKNKSENKKQEQNLKKINSKVYLFNMYNKKPLNNLNENYFSEENLLNKKPNFNKFFFKESTTNPISTDQNSTIRILDYDNRNIKNILNKQVNKDNIFNENFINKYRICHWKYIMTNDEKDLRPETFYNKNEDIMLNQNFNKKLDNMISNLQGIDMIKASNSNNHLSKDNIFKTLKLKQIKEKKSIKFVKNLLNKDKLLIEKILK